MKTQLNNQFVRTLAEGEYASTDAEHYDVQTHDRPGLIVTSSVSAIAPSAQRLLFKFNFGGARGRAFEAGLTHDALPSLGVPAGVPMTLGAGDKDYLLGAPLDLPVVIVAGVNDGLRFNQGDPTDEYQVAPGTYETADELAAAVMAAHSTIYFPINGSTFANASNATCTGAVNVVAGGYGLIVSSLNVGGYVGKAFTPGVHDALPSLGIASGAAFVDDGFAAAYVQGGALTLPVTISAGVNDGFSFGSGGPFDAFTIAPGTYSTADALAAALAAATQDVFHVSFRSWYFDADTTFAGYPIFETGSAASQTVRIEGVDHGTGRTWTILEGAAQDSTGIQVLEVGRKVPNVAGRSAASLLPHTIRVSISHATADPITRTIGVQLTP